MKRLLIVLFGLVACDAAHRNAGGGDDGGMDPVVTCGSVTCDQIPAASCVDDDTLRDYSASCVEGACSYPSEDVECGAAGCCGDHCCAIAASNADAIGAIEPTGLTVSPPNGIFNTDTECTASSALGSCTVVTRAAGLPEACVCRMDKLTIGTLEVKGARALVILAYETVNITTALDVSGDLGDPGPGALTFYPAVTSSITGGVGGSFASLGATAPGNSTTPAPLYGDATLVPLYGGTGGQGGGDRGGGGGGAVQITAGERIDITGKILAGGGGGESGYGSWSVSGAGGGGSGGAILLEAPKVVMTGTLNANGGGGGGGGGEDGSGSNGEDAFDDFPSGGDGNDGGGCPLYGSVYGGSGGNGATQTVAAGSGGDYDYDSRCLNTHFVGGGGGGGGLGRIRINTMSGCECSGTVSPNVSFGMLGVQ